jgi:hypothetical protein
MLVFPQWPLFACQLLALIGRDESRYTLLPPRSAKFNSQRDNPGFWRPF